MKKMKKLASLILAVVMVLSMTVAAFAAGNTNVDNPNEEKHTITIQNVNAGHNYQAYQIFRGDYFEEKLSNITWGYGVNGDALLVALKADDDLKDYFKDCDSAEAVAKVLSEHKELIEVSGTVDKFAKLVNANLTDEKFQTSYDDDNPPMYNMVDEKYDYVINVTGQGYYLVKDVDGKVDGNDDAYTRYIMQVVKDITVVAKAETPTVDKKIVVDNDKVESNTAAIGQDVYYEITGNVPDYTGYDKYFYVITDTLSKGLTKEDTTVEVTVGGTTLTQGNPNSETGDYYVYREFDETTKETTFQIAFADIKSYTKGAAVVVKYSATVNEDAEIGNDKGNLNTVNLTYSNNPNFEYDGKNEPGKPGIPDSNVPTGVSPDEKTLTFVAEIDISKTKEDGTALAGAQFTLTGVSKQIEKQVVNEFEPDDDGEYYKLKDGTYTTDDPQPEVTDPTTGEVIKESNEHLYESTTQKYKLTEKISDSIYLEKVEMTATSDKDGKLQFKGLGAGVYTIEETIVPDGYNKAPNVIVEIKCDVPDAVVEGNETAKWSVGNLTSTHLDDKGETVKDASLTRVEDGKSVIGLYNVTIVNVSGALLPSTGGIGTTIFYAVGIILMAGAVFFVVRKRRA